jgi:bacterial/archaeal transporter family protein
MGKTWGLTVIAILTNVSGDLLLSRGMHQVGPVVVSRLQYLGIFVNPCTILGVCILVCWLLTQLTLLSRADLSFVLPITASTYILVAVCGAFLFHEQISVSQWTGVAAISLGTVLAGCTPPRTVKPNLEREL